MVSGPGDPLQILTKAGKVDSVLSTPTKSRRHNRCIPEFCQFTVQFQQSDRSARHFKAGDVGPDETSGHLDSGLCQDIACLPVNDKELEQWRAAHAVDEKQDLVA